MELEFYGRVRRLKKITTLAKCVALGTAEGNGMNVLNDDKTDVSERKQLQVAFRINRNQWLLATCSATEIKSD